MATTNDPIIGKKLGNYNVVELLGKGGMARVYRGYDAKLNRYAAVKVFEAHLIAEHEQDEYSRRFENEARAIARLRHPNIVGVYQFDQVGTIYYMAMEYVEGRDLRHLLRNHAKNNTRMAYAEIVRVMQDIGGALDYAHQEAVIHRDVKPSNIMVTSAGKSVLTDFGLALSVPEGTQGMTFGSAHYIAPEQAVSSAQAVPQSDLYSLGIVLYEMLTNRVPFNDPAAMVVALKHISEEPPPPSRFNPNLSQAIDHVVLKALAKQPDQRFPSGQAMAEALSVAVANASDLDTDNEADLLSVWDVPSKPSALSSPSRSTVTPAASDSLNISTVRQPQPTAETTDAPTATGSLSRPSLSQPPLITPIPAPAKRPVWPAALAALGVTALVAAIVLVVATLNSGSATPTPPAVAAAATNTPSALMGLAATEEATPRPAVATATRKPTSSKLTLTPSATAEAEPTATPETTATTIPETTPAAVSTAETAVLLRYDETSLVLLNRSSQPVDVSGLTFVQIRPNGSTLEFETARWSGGNRPTTALPAGECFQVQRNDIAQLDKPDFCDLQSWSRVSFPRWFWRSDDTAATFEVRRGDTVLATCAVSAGECALEPGE